MGRITRQLERAMQRNVACPVIVKTRPDRLPELADYLISNFKMHGTRIPLFSMFATVLPVDAIDEIKQLNFVETIYLDREMRIPEISHGLSFVDPVRRSVFFRLASRFNRLSAKTMWWPTSESRKIIGGDIAESEGYTGRGVKVAVVDSDSSPRFQSHVQLRGRVTGKTVIEEASDKNGHGGHVATTAIGSTFVHRLTGLRALGVAPKATGIGVKTLRGAIGTGSTSDVIMGIAYAYMWGADVINLSLGGTPTEDPTEDPMYDAFERIKDDVVICAAIGNEGPAPGTVSSPGSLPNAIGVGAIDREGNIAEFSSRGPTPDGRIKPDVVAPGVNIWSGITIETYLDFISDHIGDGFAALSGTSMATPHVTGLMALAVELFRKELPEVKLNTPLALEIIEEYGEPKDNDYGHGLINWSWFRRYVDEHK